MSAGAEGGRMRVPHRVVEDCWYSCPKSGECCNDAAGDECNCGADAYNEYIETLESWRDRRAEEISLDLAALVQRVQKLRDALRFVAAMTGDEDIRAEVRRVLEDD